MTFMFLDMGLKLWLMKMLLDHQKNIVLPSRVQVRHLSIWQGDKLGYL